MTDHMKGIAITTLGILLVTPDTIFVRMIIADPMVISFWRGLFSGLVVLVLVSTIQGRAGFQAVFQTGWLGVLYIALIGSTTFAVVLAVEHTSVANVVFIFAAMPIFALIFSHLLLGEPIRRRMVFTMVAVIAGLGIIAYGSQSSQIASLKGDLWALYVAAAYALALTVLRMLKGTSMVPALPIGFIGAALLVGLFVDPIPAFSTQWPMFVAHGVFIGFATCLLTIGPRYISAAEVALLVLLESVLAPLLIWAIADEHPGRWAIIGGMVVIGALIVSNVVALRRRASP
ncbi:MAG: drug/metabolite transporter (DMT)-like permease [Reinekea sp.]|jgi:drug/metabolite transporter (DMT)-like permease